MLVTLFMENLYKRSWKASHRVCSGEPGFIFLMVSKLIRKLMKAVACRFYSLLNFFISRVPSHCSEKY